MIDSIKSWNSQSKSFIKRPLDFLMRLVVLAFYLLITVWFIMITMRRIGNAEQKCLTMVGVAMTLLIPAWAWYLYQGK